MTNVATAVTAPSFVSSQPTTKRNTVFIAFKGRITYWGYLPEFLCSSWGLVVWLNCGTGLESGEWASGVSGIWSAMLVNQFYHLQAVDALKTRRAPPRETGAGL